MNIAEVYPHAVIPVPQVRVFDALAIVNYEIARRLAKEHSVVVYSRRGPGERAFDTYEGVDWCRVPVSLDLAMNRMKILDKLGVFPPERPYRFTQLYYAHYAKTVAADVHKRHCEVVHVHSIANFLPVIARENPDAKLVLHMHDHSLADFDEHLIRDRLQKASLILGCSDLITNEIRVRFPEVAERCHTLHNGVDERFLRIDSAPVRSQTVLFVGRMSPEKGVHVLLDAFSAIAEEFPDARLHLVGPSDVAQKQFVDPFGRDPAIQEIASFYSAKRAYEDALTRSISSLGDRVKREGALPNGELMPAYGRAGIFVFPSVWQEPFGIPIIEAMAAGLPVVTTNGGASSEIVVDGETGILVPRGDARSLAQALRTLLSDAELRVRMGQAGRARVARLFTWDKAVSRLIRLYDGNGRHVLTRTSMGSSYESRECYPQVS